MRIKSNTQLKCAKNLYWLRNEIAKWYGKRSEEHSKGQNELSTTDTAQ